MHMQSLQHLKKKILIHILLIARFGRIDVKLSKILFKLQYVDYPEELK